MSLATCFSDTQILVALHSGYFANVTLKLKKKLFRRTLLNKHFYEKDSLFKDFDLPMFQFF